MMQGICRTKVGTTEQNTEEEALLHANPAALGGPRSKYRREFGKVQAPLQGLTSGAVREELSSRYSDGFVTTESAG